MRVPITQAGPVAKPNFTNWRDVAASPDGTKIALKGGNHIWMMNADGSNLVQVTTSTFEEAYNVDDNADKNVIPVIAEGDTRTQPGSGVMIWR